MSRNIQISRFVPSIVQNLYNFTPKNIARIEGGRLSDTFKVPLESGSERFLKISRKIEKNTAFSVKVTEEGRKLGLPFPKTYAGTNGQLFQEVPAKLSGQIVPDYLKNMTVTLVDYHKPPQSIPDTTENIIAKFYEIGKYIGQYKKFGNFVSLNKGAIPDDPLSPANIKALIYETFSLSDKMSDKEINSMATKLSHNLPKNDRIAAGFAIGLQNGQLPIMLKELNSLQKKDVLIKQTVPQGIVNNDIKPNNVFFDIHPQTKKPVITLAFDLDMATQGPLIKDLGRAIALSCFDKETGALQEEKMLAMIAGRNEQNPITANERKALSHYIELGILASYALRTSYFAEMLHGQVPAYEIDRLNPSVHHMELNSFREWNKNNRIETEILQMQPEDNVQHRSRL